MTSSPIDVSNYEVRIYIPGHDEDEEPPYVSAKFDIIKGDIGEPNPEIATKGGIVYSGSSQKLIATAPDYSNYSNPEIKYCVSENNNTPSDDDFTIDNLNAVTAADAGTYYIFYKVYGGSSYEDKVCGPFEVKIARANQSAPLEPTAEQENIGTKTVTLSAISTTGCSGNALYAKNTENSAPAEDSSWQESTVFTGLTPNTTYYFFSKISGDANHNPAVSNGKTIKTNALTTPAAPSGLAAVAPTSANGNDGKITGISTGMEYSVLQSGGAYSAYTDAAGTEITGLSGGTTVKVRLKSTEDANASEDVTLTVPQYTDTNGNNGGLSNDTPVISNDTTNKDKRAEDTAGKTATDENDITASEEAKKNVGIKLDKKLDATVDETGVSFKWGKVKKADGYIVMSAYGKKPLKKIGTVTGATNKSFKIEMIDGKPVVTSKKIKLRVKAYKIVDGKKVILGKSSVYKVKAIN